MKWRGELIFEELSTACEMCCEILAMPKFKVITAYVLCVRHIEGLHSITRGCMCNYYYIKSHTYYG